MRIDNITKKQAEELSIDIMTIKGYEVLFPIIEDYQGLCAIAYKNGHQIYSSVALNHKPYGKEIPSTEKLKKIYIKELRRKLYTEKELTKVKNYDDYSLKSYFLHNYYGKERDHLSMFAINGKTIEQRADYYTLDAIVDERLPEYPVKNPVGFCFMRAEDADFVKHQIKLVAILEKAKEESEQSEEYMVNAFYYEMGNHEYCINWQADWDVCSCFGECKYGEDKSYVDYLTEMGKANLIPAYQKAKQKHFEDAEKYGWY